MKILRRPDPTEWRRTHTHTCLTEVELELSDLRFSSDQRDGDAVTYRCPGCNEDVWLNASVVPAHLRYLVKR